MPVALITGSGKKRVGWHVADALARRNFDIAVHCRTSRTETESTIEHLRSLGVQADPFQADLADESAVKQMIDGVLARFGRIDVLVNCASVWKRIALESVTAADVREHFDINTLGTFLCCQHAGLAMVKQPEGGLIVNIGDWADARPYRDFAAYFASKAAIPGLTRMFAVELGTRNPNVRVNAVLPGPVMLSKDLPEAERRASIEGTLVKREGSAMHVAQGVLSFLDNDFITGACLTVDGGRTVYANEEKYEG
jgi:pteridine reductase